MPGIVTADGVFVRQAGRLHKLPRTRQTVREYVAGITPLGAAVREACAAILAGELQPCRWCGSIAPCDCLRWHEYMLMQDPDPHGDLSVFSDEDLRY